MFNKLAEKLVSAGTIAMLGYEIGSHVDQTHENTPIQATTIESHHSEVIVISGIVIIIGILAAIAAKILMAKLRLV